MEAPDKIFLAFDHGFVVQSSNIKEDINGNSIFLSQYVPIEYVRKDALLEWAKAEIELSKKVECVSEKSYEEGRQQVAQNLIDKLNSM